MEIETITFADVANPFLEAIERHPELLHQDKIGLSSHSYRRRQQLRDGLCYRYSYALPTPELLGALASYEPIVEMGAGRGYWASLLRAAGVDVIAYDEWPARKGAPIVGNQYLSPLNTHAYTDVLRGGPRDLARHSDRALFLCWPPIGNMAEDCLKWFDGDTLIYLGTGPDGMDAPDRFFEKLAKRWTPEASWVVEPSIWDTKEEMTVYRRRVSHNK
jgi:hypothetical protein